MEKIYVVDASGPHLDAKFQTSGQSGSIFWKIPKTSHWNNIRESAASQQWIDWWSLECCWFFPNYKSLFGTICENLEYLWPLVVILKIKDFGQMGSNNISSMSVNALRPISCEHKTVAHPDYVGPIKHISMSLQSVARTDSVTCFLAELATDCYNQLATVIMANNKPVMY